MNNPKMFRLMLFSFWLLLLLIWQPIFAQAEVTCQPQPIEALELPSEAGMLLYRSDTGEVVAAHDSFRHDQANKYEGGFTLSPNGEYLALTASDGTFNWVEVRSRNNSLIYSGAPARGNILRLHWLGDEQLIALVLKSVHRDLACNLCVGTGTVAYFVIDPFAKTYTYVEPRHTVPFYDGRWSVFESNYDFTYDGHYLFNTRVLFDFAANQPLVIQGGYYSTDTQQVAFQNFQPGIPAANAYRTLHFDSDQSGDTPEVAFSIYDFDTDTVTPLTTLSPGADIGSVSWSPDETRIAYQLSYAREDVTSSRRIELARLDTGAIHSTCFSRPYEVKDYVVNGEVIGSYAVQTVSSDFEWSRDSRYLALRASIDGSADSAGIYVYDTQTDDVYQVQLGTADIIGWMAADS